MSRAEDEQERRIAAMLAKLPAPQRDSAGRRIRLALKYGWRNVGLWSWGQPADQADLVGESPTSGFDFLPGDDEGEMQGAG